MNSGVYQIMNKQNYHMYIGSTVDFSERWRLHRLTLNRGDHRNRYLQRAWNKYGEDIFEFSIVEYIDDLNTLETREQWFTDLWNPEYSIRKECVGSQLGTKRTKESKLKMSKAREGKPPGNKGKKLSEESKRKIGLAAIGRIHSEETKLKMSIAAKGKAKSKEHALNIRKSWIKRREKTGE